MEERRIVMRTYHLISLELKRLVELVSAATSRAMSHGATESVLQHYCTVDPQLVRVNWGVKRERSFVGNLH